MRWLDSITDMHLSIFSQSMSSTGQSPSASPACASVGWEGHQESLENGKSLIAQPLVLFLNIKQDHI